MTQWTGGYVDGIDYTHGYYRELGPLHAAMALTHAGVAMPAVATACELGFGQGLSTNIHAAAASVAWYGTDFNPVQAGFAAQLAQAAGSGAQLTDQSFDDYCARTDLPDFDFIALHGVWSWVSPANRTLLRDFVQRKLKPGGVLYMSYNCQPGWAPMVPLRDLLSTYVARMTAPGDRLAHRIDAALDFADRLQATCPAYLQAYPQVAARLAGLRQHDRRYLAHEYFNADWQPVDFTEQAAVLADAGLVYACPAHHLDQLDLFHLTAPQRALLAQLPDPVRRQGVRDLLLNQHFRRDYWVKAPDRPQGLDGDGGSRLAAPAHEAAMRSQRVVLVMPRADIDLTVRTGAFAIALNETMYAPLLAALQDHQPRTVAELEVLAPMRGGVRQLFEAVFILCGMGVLAPAQAPQAAAAASTSCRRLNLALLDHARGHDDIHHLASALVGGGLPMPRIPQLFLLAQARGLRGASAWCNFAWAQLASSDTPVHKDGQPLTTPADKREELQRKAAIFERDYLAMYQALGLADEQG
ncbi:methyltransferase [Duganella sp. Leaf126]|uniref:methyltransferase regulatory domain-containing protein n=1 Tax=Duganella sp. Leaf126 TaxID=1736266 RepID=UPI0007013A82|nr:methyltransferase regulatory domain-containing protein [Duganella sp. Leaf126]KQQ33751.1 methyltransferase [Duganella sp. Leaf126]